MNIKAPESFTSAQRIAFYDCPENKKHYLYSTRGGWVKEASNPVLGGKFGTCFDMALLKEEGIYKMWFSWRPKRSIAYTESEDGMHWSDPVSVLDPVPGSSFEADEVNRPIVIRRNGMYQMWYSGQMRPYMEDGVSVLVYAESKDGMHWEKRIPVLAPDQAWEQHSVMCPHVLFDEEEKKYKLWYSAGCNHEPDAIGYAESFDGIHWTKHPGNPVLEKDPNNEWEQHKVVACQVLKLHDWYYMFYVGHMHEERASIGLARSRNGIDGWEKHPQNPLIAPEPEGWDAVSIYKPFVLWDEDHWTLWYNGAAYDEETWVFEQIGIARLYQEDFGF